MDSNGDSTLFFNSKAQLIGVSYDKNENAIVIIPDENLVAFGCYRVLDAYNGLTRSVPETQQEKDNRNKEYRKLGDTYILDGMNKLLEKSDKDINKDKGSIGEGYSNEWGAKLYLDSNGDVRVDIAGAYTDKSPNGVVSGNHSGSPGINVVSDIHTHPNAGEYVYGEGRPSDQDYDSPDSNDKYYDVVIENKYIIFYNSNANKQFRVSRESTFNMKQLKKDFPESFEQKELKTGK